METVGAYEAKTHLGQLLDKVAHGESITITRKGVPVAQLVPIGPSAGDAAAIAAELRRLRRGVRLAGLTVHELIEEGRR